MASATWIHPAFAIASSGGSVALALADEDVSAQTPAGGVDGGKTHDYTTTTGFQASDVVAYINGVRRSAADGGFVVLTSTTFRLTGPLDPLDTIVVHGPTTP